MPSDLSAYRRLYAALLALYPAPYRARFGEGMMQTFHDVCRDRVRVGEPILPFALGLFAETFVGIIKERISFFSFLFMSKGILRPLIATLIILLIPLVGTFTVEGWNWDAFDFVIAGIVLFTVFFMIEFLARKMRDIPSRIAAGITVIMTLLIVWVNLAVGIIGDGNNTSACYMLVVPVGFLGLAVSRLKPKGLSVTAFCMAAIMLLVPTVAWLTGNQDLEQDPNVLKVFVLSAGFAFWYAVAGALFLSTARTKTA